MKKNNKSKQGKAQENNNNTPINNDKKRTKDSNDSALRFEAGEVFDSMDFSPESWKKD
ncbi:hypothetical protein [Sporosarcina sp. 6E9]|uniref:hypothetical protein n=1 Tax=Sporosarcina sp. 6E9 TaxID=2819235 RepID=UPI001B3088AE|nr:hypothetical protein [Sporosarcina sp. 6E9]